MAEKKEFRITVGARCYDTYDVTAESGAAAFRKVQAYDGTDEDVAEVNLGEVIEQDYQIDDIITIEEAGEDVTQEVLDELDPDPAEAPVLRIVTSVRTDEQECFDAPSYAVVTVTPKLVARAKELLNAVRRAEAYRVECFGFPAEWWKNSCSDEDPLDEETVEEELEKKHGSRQGLVRESMDCQMLCVLNTGDFRIDAYVKHTNLAVSTDLLRIERMEKLLRGEE